jgi:hypothetical protein
MTGSGWAWRVLLAVLGFGVGVYLSKLIGGVIGGLAMGAIAAGCAKPLFDSPFAWRRQRIEARRKAGA